jgi:plastocyanin
MRKFATPLSALALVLVTWGCGGGEGTTDSNATPAPTATTQSGAGSTLELAADPGGSLAYVPTQLTAKSGSVTIDFANETQVPHDVVVEQDDEDLGATDEITASTTELTVELAAGGYTFYCSVPGHRQAGMEGTLTVK